MRSKVESSLTGRHVFCASNVIIDINSKIYLVNYSTINFYSFSELGFEIV